MFSAAEHRDEHRSTSKRSRHRHDTSGTSRSQADEDIGLAYPGSAANGVHHAHPPGAGLRWNASSCWGHKLLGHSDDVLPCRGAHPRASPALGLIERADTDGGRLSNHASDGIRDDVAQVIQMVMTSSHAEFGCQPHWQHARRAEGAVWHSGSEAMRPPQVDACEYLVEAPRLCRMATPLRRP